MTEVSVPDPETTVVVPANEAIAPVIDHTERITNLEHGLTDTEAKLLRRLEEVQSELGTAMDAAREENNRQLQEHIQHLEALEAQLTERLNSMVEQSPPVSAVEETPAVLPSAEHTETELEPPPTQAKHVGIHGRRKERMKNARHQA
jgi:hypothetical protein